MNSKVGHCDNEFKQPFSETTVSDFSTYFQYARNYIKGLKLIENGVKKSILKSKSYTSYFGMYHNMSSFIGIYEDYIKPNGIEEFYAFTVSQDLVENFFGMIRQRNGHNSNPNEQQVVAAYKKLLFQHEVSISNHSNCENDFTKMFTVSSGKKSSVPQANQNELETLENYDFEHAIDDNDSLDAVINYDINNIENNSRAYLAGVVEKAVIFKLVRKGRKMCQSCINVFVENEICDDQFIVFKSKGTKILPPCQSTLMIIHTILSQYSSLQVSFASILKHIVGKLDFSQLYESSNFSEDHDHKADLIECVIETYLDQKSRDVAKLITRMTQDKLFRHEDLKKAHRSGQ